MKILIVGHDAELCAITGKILERSGYTAVCRVYDAETPESISRDTPALVIAELETDENERIRFCKAVKSLGSPPKLMLIGRSSEEETNMLNAGADDWIEKPYRTDVFLARVSALIRQCGNISPTAEREDY